MSEESRLVVFHLTDSAWDGMWRQVEGSPRTIEVWVGQAPTPGEMPEGTPVLMVPTGNLEWDGNTAAEVYVPEHKLALWRAEHDVEPES